jgi:cytochrome c biogenesis protein CcdA
MQQWMPLIKKISGVVLIVVGLVLLYNFSLTLA